MNRNLAVRTYPEFDAGIPSDSTHWTLAELKEWKSILDNQRVGGACSKFDARWEQMLDYRHERLGFYIYSSSADLPAEVVQELPLGHVASRAFWVAPAVELASHEMARLITTMKARATGTKREAQIVSKIVQTWNSRKAFRSDRQRSKRRWAVLPGGLCISVNEEIRKPTISVNWHGLHAFDVAATVDQLPDLKRFVRLWRTMLRNLVAASLSLALPKVPKLEDRPFLALELRNFGSVAENVVVISNTTPYLSPGAILRGATVLREARAHDNWAERFELAGLLLRSLDRTLPSNTDRKVTVPLNAVIADLVQRHFHGTPFRRLRPDFVDVKTVLDRVDDITRKQVVAMKGGKEVRLASDADTYVVKDPVWPTKTIRFTSLALAVDFERSNRDTKAMSVFAKAA